VLLLISIIAGKTTGKLGVPTLIFFLVVGILAGSEGIGGIYFDNAELAQFIGIVALNFYIVFRWTGHALDKYTTYNLAGNFTFKPWVYYSQHFDGSFCTLCF
jgi:uncharacterized membrane protein YtjA (UPF0391 family)